MPPVFDAYVMVDWSAAAVPTTGADSVWIAVAERNDGALPAPRLFNPATRAAASSLLADLLSDLVARDRVTLAGFDFAFGYPSGFAARLRGPGADWRSVWNEIASRIRDADDNANNRFAVAAALNERLSGRAFPFWGCPAPAAGPLLTTTKPAGFDDEVLAELRVCDRAAGGPYPVWKLAYPGSVGSQTLLGIAHLQSLRRHPWLADTARLWPFEIGLSPVERPGNGGWQVLLAEIYPSIFDSRDVAHEIKDARQVQAVIAALGRRDEAGSLGSLFAGPADLTGEQRRTIETEEGWILGIETATGPRRGRPTAAAPSPSTAGYDYVRDPGEIYRRSFATIRAEADLGGMPADLEPLAVRVIHAAGDPAIARELAWSEGAAAAGRDALAHGAPILVDTNMVSMGIIRARLPLGNPVICTLDEPDLAEAARAAGTTRSAAAVDRWRDRLEGAVVVIGNAPTALFRLLELLDGGAPRPALILGFPVGFVGAAESKQALIAHGGGVPFIALRGRRGGSAMAAACVNALAAGDA
jgi:precorrin-8X/cobalt-precorrin-8 methylmutase